MTDQIEIGDIAKDTVTGFEGTVISRTEWLNGCVRLQLKPQGIHEGKTIESEAFDIEQLVLVKRAKSRKFFRATGGPHPTAR